MTTKTQIEIPRYRKAVSAVLRVLRLLLLVALVVAVGACSAWYLAQALEGDRMQAELDAQWENLSPPPHGQVIFEPGDIIGRIIIPKLGLDAVMVEMANVDDKENLNKGPAHIMDTALPGEEGNCVIAGHRTTYSRPFFALDSLTAGDDVILIDVFGDRHGYEVTQILIVEPDDVWVMDPTPQASVTLIACHPLFSASKRIVVKGDLATDCPGWQGDGREGDNL